MKWRVKNFKGIADCEVLLETGIATVLTGINSSGKTSLIQSLLLIRQSRPADRGLVLNGPLVRLGNALDLVRDADAVKSILLELEDEGDVFNIELVPGSSRASNWHEVGAEEDPLGASLQLARLTVGSDGQPGLVKLVGRGIRTTDSELIHREFSSMGELTILRLQQNSAAVQKGSLPRVYVVFNGIRPTHLVRCYDRQKYKNSYRRKLLDAIVQYNTAVVDSSEVRRRVNPLIRTLRQLLIEELGSYLNADVDRPFSTGIDLKSNPYKQSEEMLQRMLNMREEEIYGLVDSVVDSRAKNPISVVEIRRGSSSRDQNVMDSELWDQARGVAQLLARYSSAIGRLRTRLNYLGPLRDEPRVVWGQWNSETPGLPVGIRGELAASYLAQNADKDTFFVSPVDAQSRRGTLGEATNLWLEYLGIGSGINPRSYGKIGVGVEIKLQGRTRDLTSVGVGVSQAFPIVIAGLAVSSGSIFIVEQPELHLHPDVQSKLADFFLFARPDVAFIVETHSEAFITRLRRRVAEGTSEPSDVQLIFVESPNEISDEVELDHDNGAVGRRISLTRTGDFEEWPKGFVSGSMEDTQAILAANVRRVRESSKHGA